MDTISIDTIVVPQGAEYQAVCRGVQRAKSKIRVVAIPLGTKNLAPFLQDSNGNWEKIENLLIVGLCGSLDSNYSVGDAILYQSCQNIDSQKIDLKSEFTTAIKQKLNLQLVTGITSDRLIAQKKAKLQLAQTYPVSVVDMEGYDCVRQLQAKKITVAILRIVSDDLTGDIPDLSRAIDPQGNLKPIPMAIAFIEQPIAAWRLITGSLKALKILEQEIYKLVCNS